MPTNPREIELMKYSLSDDEGMQKTSPHPETVEQDVDEFCGETIDDQTLPAVPVNVAENLFLKVLLNMPNLCKSTYYQHEEKVTDAWDAVSKDLMKQAIEEEIHFARQASNVTRNGVTLITVVADGCWSKRSYRTNFTSLFGVLSIAVRWPVDISNHSLLVTKGGASRRRERAKEIKTGELSRHSIPRRTPAENVRRSETSGNEI
ncbi:hypothetical protein B566_EDAN013508 [Ephemera danica]|nr:hypothetical protein B566_EDAN013508 [Ephemera danica]